MLPRAQFRPAALMTLRYRIFFPSGEGETWTQDDERYDDWQFVLHGDFWLFD